MTQLPVHFTEQTRRLMGEERFGRYLSSFNEEPPVSIRLNPWKAKGMEVVNGEPVPWCRHGYYLPRRPNFTMDPLLHAGCYYVQEAASMFLDHVFSIIGAVPQCSLDLCAAPGGKSTLLRAVLPDDCVLYSNEPVRNRANILAENVQKWGGPNHIVINLYPRDYRKSKQRFDLILCDVPCSGEGMFRKDPATIGEWSPQQVEKCWKLQREIVDDAWACLNDGGVLIYSTCTFNTKENEENIRYFLTQYEAELLTVNVKPEWHITGSLLPGFNQPVYRFIPGISRGEGLFLCVLRKKGGTGGRKFVGTGVRGNLGGTGVRGYEGTRIDERQNRNLTILVPPYPPTPPPTNLRTSLTYPQAMAYLRGEALQLSEDTPRGEVEVCFQGHPLGLVKNIGTRANNLYPKAWRIKTTHIPTDYTPILTPNTHHAL